MSILRTMNSNCFLVSSLSFLSSPVLNGKRWPRMDDSSKMFHCWRSNNYFMCFRLQREAVAVALQGRADDHKIVDTKDGEDL